MVQQVVAAEVKTCMNCMPSAPLQTPMEALVFALLSDCSLHDNRAFCVKTPFWIKQAMQHKSQRIEGKNPLAFLTNKKKKITLLSFFHIRKWFTEFNIKNIKLFAILKADAGEFPNDKPRRLIVGTHLRYHSSHWSKAVNILWASCQDFPSSADYLGLWVWQRSFQPPRLWSAISTLQSAASSTPRQQDLFGMQLGGLRSDSTDTAQHGRSGFHAISPPPKCHTLSKDITGALETHLLERRRPNRFTTLCARLEGHKIEGGKHARTAILG